MSELKPYAFIAIATGGGQIGYRSILVAANNENEAIGVGFRKVSDLCPAKEISEPSVLEITMGKLEEINAPLPITPAQAARVLLDSVPAKVIACSELAKHTGLNQDLAHYGWRMLIKAIAEQEGE